MSNAFAIKDVLNFTVEEYVSFGRGKILFTVDYAGNTNINTTAERLPIRGGQGNYKIMDIDHSKDVEFSATLPLVDIKALAMKLGTEAKKGASKAPFDRIFTVGAESKVSLPAGITPIANTLKVCLVEGKRDIKNELEVAASVVATGTYTITGQDIALFPEDAPVGSKVFISCDYTTGVDSQSLKITADDFPSEIVIRGEGVVTDEHTKEKSVITFKVHNAKVKPEFEITMAGDSATELEFNCDCYAVTDVNDEKVFIDIVKIGK